MKDSQLEQLVYTVRNKYIKANNERFSTILWLGERGR